MITRTLLIAALGVFPISAAEPSTADLLRQGLFEEEANRDFDKAAESYRAVIAAHDKQRALAATATYRLGEIARKKNDKEAAAKAFQLVAERFPEQTELARLSRENLVALGVSLASPGKTDPPPAITNTDPEDAEIARLKEIASNSPDLIDGADPSGWRPMHTAAKNGWTKVIAYLLGNKADPNSRTAKEQYTPLHIAAIHGQLAAVKSLLAAKADINTTTDRRINSPLMEQKAESLHGDWSAIDFAVLFDRKEIARTLIKAGADIQQSRLAFGSYQASEPFTTLLAAIYLNRSATALDLIEAGAPLERVGGERATSPLSLAARECPDLVAPLLKAGAKPNDSGTSLVTTPLIEAAIKDRLAVTKLLIDAGADVNAFNTERQTPLHLVVSAQMADLLASKGADLNAKDRQGSTPLDYAAKRDNTPPDALETLLKRGATVENTKALLKLTSRSKLPAVREKVVYPKEQKPDAILLSLDCEDTPPNGFPAVIDAAEIRPALGSPPPSIPEILCLYFKNGSFPSALGQLKIVRRGTDGSFKNTFDWTPKDDSPELKNPPALEWGDILEVTLTNRRGMPSISSLAWPTPRTVNMRLEGFTFPRLLAETSEIWLGPTDEFAVREGLPGSRSPRAVPPSMLGGGRPIAPPRTSTFSLIPDFVDSTRIQVTRKGVEKPIVLDLTLKDARPFRLVEGDVIDLIPLESVRKSIEERGQVMVMTQGSVRYLSSSLGFVKQLNELRESSIYGKRTPSDIDWSAIRILRGAAGKESKTIDLFAWADALPDPETWDREKIRALDPELKAGDIVIIPSMPEDPDADGKKPNPETKKRLEQAMEFLSRITPTPGQAQPPPPQSR